MLKKTIFIIIDILLVIVFAFIIVQERAKDAEYETQNIEITQSLSKLQDQKSEIKEKLSELEGSTDEKSYIKSTITPLFTNTNAYLYTDIYPSMQEKDIQGTFALSLDSFPGDLNCITVAQFVELKNAGWDCCLYWDGSYEDVSTWYQDLQYRMTLYNFDVPTVVYCKDGTYTEELENELAQLGITGIINHGENDSGTSELETTDNGLWRIYSCTNEEVSSNIESGLYGKDCIVLTAGDEENMTYDIDSKDSLMNLFDSIESYYTNDKGNVRVRIEPVSDIVSYRQKKERQLEEKKAENAQELDDLKQELEDIQDQINELTQS